MSISDGVEITEPLVAALIIDTQMDTMTVESNNGGGSFARNVRGLIRGKSPCSIIDETQTNNKETRILMNAGYIKEYFYFRNDYEPGSDYDKYMRALTSYVKLGKNKHDDAPDATTGLAEQMKWRNFDKPVTKTNIVDEFRGVRQNPSNTIVDESFISYGSDEW